MKNKQKYVLQDSVSMVPTGADNEVTFSSNLLTNLALIPSDGMSISIVNADLHIKASIDQYIIGSNNPLVSFGVIRAKNGATLTANTESSSSHPRTILDAAVNDEFVFEEIARFQLPLCERTAAQTYNLVRGFTISVKQKIQSFVDKYVNSPNTVDIPIIMFYWVFYGDSGAATKPHVYIVTSLEVEYTERLKGLKF